VAAVANGPNWTPSPTIPIKKTRTSRIHKDSTSRNELCETLFWGVCYELIRRSVKRRRRYGEIVAVTESDDFLMVLRVVLGRAEFYRVFLILNVNDTNAIRLEYVSLSFVI
jgi:hypothetical protein